MGKKERKRVRLTFFWLIYVASFSSGYSHFYPFPIFPFWNDISELKCVQQQRWTLDGYTSLTDGFVWETVTLGNNRKGAMNLTGMLLFVRSSRSSNSKYRFLFRPNPVVWLSRVALTMKEDRTTVFGTSSIFWHAIDSPGWIWRRKQKVDDKP